MVDSGWVYAYRKAWTHPAFNNLREAAIWNFLYQNAFWEDGERNFNGHTFLLKRGQIVVSISFLAKGFCMSDKGVRVVIQKLEKLGMLVKQGANKGTIITICNYDDFQKKEKTKGEQEGKRGANEGQTRGDNNNEGNEINEINEINEVKDSLSDFEEFWKSWTPYKTGKGSKADAKEIYLKITKEIDHETLSKISTEYCKFCETTDCNTKNVFRWLKKRGWEDDYTIPTKGNGASDNKESYSSQIIAAAERAGEQLRIREEERDFGEGGNAPFDEGGETDYSILPNPGDIGPDTIPFAPIGDAQEDGRE